MGHHTITEITQEKYTFNGRSKMIAIILFVVGAVLAAVGAMDVEKHWNDVPEAEATEQVEDHGEAHGEDHGSEHMSTLTDEDAHGGSHKEAHSADHNAEAHDAGGHGEAHGGEHGEETHGGHHEKTFMSRVWANLLMNSYYFFLFGVGAMFFLAVNYVANAGWATMIKRVMEAVSSYIMLGFILLYAVVVFGKDTIYHWVQYFNGGAGDDAILESKHWLLNNTALMVLLPVMVAVWFFIRYKIRSNSIAEDGVENGDLTYHKSSTRWSAGFIFFFAFSFSAIAWLVIMSIDAHWYSTMFSVYNFAVAFVTGLSVMMLVLLYLKSKGYMEMVSDEVVHDLGKFMFAFCVFWGYIFLGQWLLIWYTNLPEETIYFAARLEGAFRPLFFINIIMCFLAPFLILMMRNAKRNPKVLVLAALVILIGHWIDMYLMVMPGVVGSHAGIGMLEIGTTMAFIGIFIFVVLHSLSKANLYAVNHPYILESANHDVGP